MVFLQGVLDKAVQIKVDVKMQLQGNDAAKAILGGLGIICTTGVIWHGIDAYMESHSPDLESHAISNDIEWRRRT